MKKQPLISVIVPIYNVEKYLHKCLDSILKQTYQNLEIILVDDGATDESEKIADEYAKKDARIMVIHQKNGGLSDARNAGLKKATGDFVTFVDSDDWIAPDMVEYLVSAHADIVICSHYEENEDETLRNFNLGFERKEMESEEALREMLLEHGFMVSAWGKLYRRELFDDIEFPKGKLFEDVATTYKLIMRAQKIVFLPDAKYYYLQRQSSISKSKFNKQKMDILTLTNQMCDEIDKKYPSLKKVTKTRRLRAKLSVVKQLTGIKMRGYHASRLRH